MVFVEAHCSGRALKSDRSGCIPFRRRPVGKTDRSVRPDRLDRSTARWSWPVMQGSLPRFAQLIAPRCGRIGRGDGAGGRLWASESVPGRAWDAVTGRKAAGQSPKTTRGRRRVVGGREGGRERGLAASKKKERVQWNTFDTQLPRSCFHSTAQRGSFSGARPNLQD